MEIFFLKLLMWMQLGISKLVDDIFSLFTVFAGVEDVNVKVGDNVKTESLLSHFVTNDSVIKVFWYIMIIGTVLAFIFTVIGVVKNMATGKKAMGAVVAKLGVSIVSMVLVVMLIFLGIFGVNLVLSEINMAFNTDNELTVGQQLFESAVPEEAWADKATGGKYSMADLVEKDENGKPKWKKGVNADTIFGVREKEWGLLEKSADTCKAATPEMVNFKDYNFFISLPAVIIMGVVIFMAIMGLVARLFDIVFLLLTSPLIMATLPLDDGAKFKLWRETFISKALLAYGTVFSVNIYLLILPLIDKITIPGALPSINGIMHMFLIICGALTISAGQLLFSRLMGTSAEENRQQTHGLRMMFAGVAGTAAAVGSAGKMVLGAGKYAYKGGRGVMNTSAKVLTGGYKGRKLSTGIKEDVKGLAAKMSTKMTESGGLLGAARAAYATQHSARHPIEPPDFIQPPAATPPATPSVPTVPVINSPGEAKPTSNQGG